MKKSIQLLLAGAGVALALNAQAVPLEFSTAISNTVTDVENADDGTTLDFNQFNASLGTLKAVRVDLYNTFSGTFKVENTSANSAASFTYLAEGAVTLDGGLTTTSAANFAFNLSSYDHLNDYAGTSGASHAFAPAKALSSQNYTTAGSLGQFVGSDQLHWLITGVSNAWTNGNTGNLTTIVPTRMDTYAVVTYSYVSAVPEPESFAMMAAGLGLMGLVLRKRKAA
jgi:hypothetical protein